MSLTKTFKNAFAFEQQIIEFKKYLRRLRYHRCQRNNQIGRSASVRKLQIQQDLKLWFGRNTKSFMNPFATVTSDA